MVEADDAASALALADGAFATSDLDRAIAHLSAAIRALTAAGRRREAAMASVRLGDAFTLFLGNFTAGRVWYARAARLVEDEEPCIEQGWVAVAAMGCDVDDPATLLAAAELALDRARRFGDVNLETKALADGGLAHVQAGRVDQGMAMLDEAMALACSATDDASAAAKSVCSMFTACYHAADFERASSWTAPLRQRGLIAVEPGEPMWLSSHCDSVQSAMLVELGRWRDAESILVRAMADFESLMGSPGWHPSIALAELRILQGRYTDAEALLIGKDAMMQALLPMARLHLARGDHELACAAARRGLRVMGDDRLRSASLLAVLADAELARGDVPAASAAADELARRAAEVDIPVVRGRAAAVRARVLAASGDLHGAIDIIDGLTAQLAGTSTPWLESMLLVELARLRERAGDTAGAVIDAKAAAAALAALDVVVAADDATLLARLTGVAAPSGTATLAADGRGWIVRAGGVQVRLPDSKGLRHLAELIRTPGVERHALDLVDRLEGVGEVDRRALGDAGALVDGSARTAYRRRIEALRAEIDDALAVGADDRAEALQGEIDVLVAQLAAAFGLGGRARVAASAAERARLNVTRAVRSAIGRLRDEVRDAGAALDRSVRTGMYCAYEPVDGEIRWIVQS